ncbi:MAG: hypothetical protein EZS28_054767, partial [Streblomastix strix]
MIRTSQPEGDIGLLFFDATFSVSYIGYGKDESNFEALKKLVDANQKILCGYDKNKEWLVHIACRTNDSRALHYFQEMNGRTA